MDMQIYHDAVWTQVEEHGGPMETLGRDANAELVTGLRNNGLSPTQAAVVMIELVTRAHQTLKHCFPILADLDKTVQLMGALVDEGAHVPDAMTRMLEAKLQMAQIYNFIALIGPGADVEDLPSVAKTQQMIEESEAELSAWRARLHGATQKSDA